MGLFIYPHLDRVQSIYTCVHWNRMNWFKVYEFYWFHTVWTQLCYTSKLYADGFFVFLAFIQFHRWRGHVFYSGSYAGRSLFFFFLKRWQRLHEICRNFVNFFSALKARVFKVIITLNVARIPLSISLEKLVRRIHSLLVTLWAL